MIILPTEGHTTTHSSPVSRAHERFPAGLRSLTEYQDIRDAGWIPALN